jgi:Sulfatase
MPSHPSRNALAKTKPRIIWVVLDELSYQQIYVDRFQGLQLPAFDALANEATLFTHPIPASIPIDTNIRTEKILPSLMTGKPVDDLNATAAGQLSIHNPDTGAWQSFDQHGTVFQDALNDGYRTAVAGWYNPYCRLLPAVLDHCVWAFGDNPQSGMLPGGTLASNLPQPILSFVMSRGLPRSLQRFLPKNPSDPELHIADYQNLSDAADKILRDPSLDFVFLHLPVPHPGGIYNRKTGQLTTGPSTYIDNLALADKYLAHLRSTLEQSGQWDSSTVVIMGDHGWRIMEWNGAAEWTTEEQNASHGGRFDNRPAYIVKLAGQQKGTRIDTPFHALNTRKLLDALLTQNIRSADDLSTWAQQLH